MQKITSLHCIVSGNVQGIGYRWFVERTAKKCGLTGWVKNLSNGDVEIEAEGEKTVLESFLALLYNDHSPASVSDISTKWQTHTENAHSSFEIAY